MSTLPPTVSVLANSPGASVAKFLITLHQSHGLRDDAVDLASKFCRRTPSVEATFTSKAATPVGAGSTVDWAGGQRSSGLSAEAFQLLQGRSILGAVAPRFRRVPWRTKIARETGAGAGSAWRGEGLPSPVTSSLFDVLEQAYFEITSVVVATNELLQFGSNTERLLSDLVTAAVSRFVDAQLLDPS